MRRSTFALLAAGMFVFAGTSDLRAQDAEVEAAASEDAPSDVQNVEAMIMNPGAAEPTMLTVEFSGSGEPGGTTIDCELMRLDDDSFRGECDAGGVPIEMTIEAFEE